MHPESQIHTLYFTRDSISRRPESGHIILTLSGAIYFTQQGVGTQLISPFIDIHVPWWCDLVCGPGVYISMPEFSQVYASSTRVSLHFTMELRINGVARELNIKEKWPVDSFICVAVHTLASKTSNAIYWKGIPSNKLITCIVDILLHGSSHL